MGALPHMYVGKEPPKPQYPPHLFQSQKRTHATNHWTNILIKRIKSVDWSRLWKGFDLSRSWSQPPKYGTFTEAARTDPEQYSHDTWRDEFVHMKNPEQLLWDYVQKHVDVKSGRSNLLSVMFPCINSQFTIGTGLETFVLCKEPLNHLSILWGPFGGFYPMVIFFFWRTCPKLVGYFSIMEK